MSATELVETIRAGFADEGGFTGLDSEDAANAFVAAIEPHATDDFVCRMIGAGDLAFEGIDGLRTGWQDFLEGFDFLRITPESLRETEAGDVVVEFVRMEARPKGTAATLEQPAAAVWRFRGEELEAIEFHVDRDAAMRSAGLA